MHEPDPYSALMPEYTNDDAVIIVTVQSFHTLTLSFRPVLESTRSGSRSTGLDMVQRQQLEPGDVRWRASSVQKDHPPESAQRHRHPARRHGGTTATPAGESGAGGATAEPGPAGLVWIWRVRRVSCPGREAAGGAGLPAALHRRDWKPGPPRSADPESVLSEQRFCGRTLTGAVPGASASNGPWEQRHRETISNVLQN